MESQKFKIFTYCTAAVLLAVQVGCDDSSKPGRPTTVPTTSTAAIESHQASTVLASAMMQPPSVLTLEGRDEEFPAAKLALIDHRAGGLTLRLCSDDPPAALDPGYAGNSYVLDMKLAIDRLEDLPASSWDYRSADPSDLSNGIFINGSREQYQPAEVHVTFQTEGNEIVTVITGEFLHDDLQKPGAAPQRIQVSGILRSPKPMR